MIEEIAAIQKEVVVPLSQHDSFRLFTESIDDWWPKKTHSVGQDETIEIALEEKLGGKIYEVTRNGERHEWGEMRSFDPPRELSFSWHPGRAAETGQVVTVNFESIDSEKTRIRIVHEGWENLGNEARRLREQYENGWSVVLQQYVNAGSRPPLTPEQEDSHDKVK